MRICLSGILSICLSVYLSICLPVHIYCVFAYLSICLMFICLSVYPLSMSTCLSAVYLSRCLAICLYVYHCLSVSLPVYLSVFLSVYLSIFLSFFWSIPLSFPENASSRIQPPAGKSAAANHGKTSSETHEEHCLSESNHFEDIFLSFSEIGIKSWLLIR